uniref:Uncharacterized protein n=1 Tax=viral metagenome TaxID=1070528 RepID=A0A6C0HCJ7_9ZZZZ
MTSISNAAYFGPGGVTTVTRQIINRQYLTGGHPQCLCVPASSNKKVLSNAIYNENGIIIKPEIIKNMDLVQTQNERIATIIKYSPGGRVQYGNPCSIKPTTFLGRTEGQPGGIICPLKNKF